MIAQTWIDPPVTLHHAAVVLAVSVRHVRRLVGSGQLKGVPIGERMFIEFTSLAVYTAARGIDVERNYCGEVIP
jgi:hypothetical protein